MDFFSTTYRNVKERSFFTKVCLIASRDIAMLRAVYSK